MSDGIVFELYGFFFLLNINMGTLHIFCQATVAVKPPLLVIALAPRFMLANKAPSRVPAKQYIKSSFSVSLNKRGPTIPIGISVLPT